MRKKLIILLQIIIAFVLIASSVYAAVSTTLELNMSTVDVNKGQEFEVVMSLKDVDSAKKVSSISGYINYNKDIFEAITVDSIVKDSNNKVTIGGETLPVEDLTNKTIDQISLADAYVGFNGNPSSGNDVKLVIDFQNGISQDTNVITFKFKVKSDVRIDEFANAIEYKLFVITAGDEETAEISRSIKVKVVEKKEENNTPANNTPANNTPANNTPAKNTPAKNNTVNNTNTAGKNTNTNTNKTIVNVTQDNTVAGSVLPATGARMVIIPAIILILCAYVFYNRYMKYKEF